MKLFDLDPGQRWLFCMTHPDDEISICAWIRRLVQAGAEVHLSWTHNNQVREQEAKAVGHLLGLRQDHLHFHGASDGSVCEEIPELLPQFRQLMEMVRPDRVVCGAFEQGHLDHDSTNFLVNQTFRGPILEVPLYHTYLTRFQRLNRFADPYGEQVIELTKDERALKLHVAKQYPSQNIWSVLLWYEIWQRTRLSKAELARTERMRLQTHKNYLEPNLPPRLAMRVEQSLPWQRWMRAMYAVGYKYEPALGERSLVDALR